MLGSLGYATIGEPLLDVVASKLGLNQADEFIKGIAGFLISQNTSGVVKATADSAVTIAAYKVAGQRIGNVLGNLGVNSTNSQTTQTKTSEVIYG